MGTIKEFKKRITAILLPVLIVITSFSSSTLASTQFKTLKNEQSKVQKKRKTKVNKKIHLTFHIVDSNNDSSSESSFDKIPEEKEQEFLPQEQQEEEMVQEHFKQEGNSKEHLQIVESIFEEPVFEPLLFYNSQMEEILENFSGILLSFYFIVQIIGAKKIEIKIVERPSLKVLVIFFPLEVFNILFDYFQYGAPIFIFLFNLFHTYYDSEN